MEKPISLKLSVIVPVYKVEDYLEACIESILSQGVDNMELILVDDGSPDRCPEICDRYAAADPRVVVVHKQNGGVSAARNTGIDMARGEYLAFCDSDDFIAPGTYLPAIEALDQFPDIEAVQFPITERYNTPEQFERRVPSPVTVVGGDNVFRSWQTDGDVVTGYLINKVYRRRLFDMLRFRDGIYYEDRYFETDLFPMIRAMRIIPEGGYFYNVRPGSIVNSKLTEKHVASRVVADHYLSLAIERIGGLDQRLSVLKCYIYYYYLKLGRYGNRKAIMAKYDLSPEDIAVPSLKDLWRVLKYSSRKGLSLFTKLRKLLSIH